MAELTQPISNAGWQDAGRVIPHANTQTVGMNGGNSVQLLNTFDDLSQVTRVGQWLLKLELQFHWREKTWTERSGTGFNCW
jgi:hypothetical protein